MKSISNFTTKSSISLQLSTAPSFKLFGIPFGSSLGVEIKKEKVGNKINCYRIAEVEVGFIIGKKKYYETPIDCDTYQALSGTTYKEEVMVGPIVIIDDNQAYLDFNIEADINPFSLEVGIQQKH